MARNDIYPFMNLLTLEEVYRFRSVDGTEAVNTYVGHNFSLLLRILNSVSFSFQNATIVNAKERPYYLAAHV